MQLIQENEKAYPLPVHPREERRLRLERS